MRTASLGLVASLCGLAAVYIGCASGDDEVKGGSGASGGGGSTSEGGAGGNGLELGGGGAGGGLAACARFTESAEQAPAAMLIALDMSASMSGAKWGAAQLAIVSAIDKDAFDSMSLGLVTFPSSYSDPPQCLCDQLGIPDPVQCAAAWPGFTGMPGVSCGVSALPQVAIAPAGTEKSNGSSGVRSNVYQYLAGTNPISTADDGSPIYEAMLAGYNALGATAGVNRRILVVVTDGGFSCTSLSNNPVRAAFDDANGCADWEHPDNVNALIAEHRDDPTTPINAFVVGVPGSDSTGQKVGGFDTPPYSMLLALSTYAVSGAPNTVDPTCDSAAVFAQGSPAPAKPCHIDLASGQMFDANALADAITKIRGQALGCVYPLPDAPAGEVIAPEEVNVNVTINGMETTLPRRSDPSDDCAVDGCWDYNEDGDVEILGAACAEIGSADSASVEILVGCQTIVK